MNFASMFNDITQWESQTVQNKCPAQANEVATYAARFRLGYWCWSRGGKDLEYKEEQLPTSLQTVDGTNSLSE